MGGILSRKDIINLINNLYLFIIIKHIIIGSVMNISEKDLKDANKLIFEPELEMEFRREYNNRTKWFLNRFGFVFVFIFLFFTIVDFSVFKDIGR